MPNITLSVSADTAEEFRSIVAALAAVMAGDAPAPAEAPKTRKGKGASEPAAPVATAETAAAAPVAEMGTAKKTGPVPEFLETPAAAPAPAPVDAGPSDLELQQAMTEMMQAYPDVTIGFPAVKEVLAAHGLNKLGEVGADSAKRKALLAAFTGGLAKAKAAAAAGSLA